MSGYPAHVLEAIDRDIRETKTSFIRLSEKHGVGVKLVRARAKDLEPGSYHKRIGGRAAKISPESKIMAVALHLDGLLDSEIAERIGCHYTTVHRILQHHADTIEAAREEAAPAPVAAKPVARIPDWIAEDAALMRSIDRLRAAPGIIPVGECV
jgi:transposase-like protein